MSSPRLHSSACSVQSKTPAYRCANSLAQRNASVLVQVGLFITRIFIRRQCPTSTSGPVYASQQTQNICTTFVQRRPNVSDVGPTLYKCYTNVFVFAGVTLCNRVGPADCRVIGILYRDALVTTRSIISVTINPPPVSLSPKPFLAVISIELPPPLFDQPLPREKQARPKVIHVHFLIKSWSMRGENCTTIVYR